MSATTTGGAIQIGAAPKVRMWQVVLLAAAIALSMVLGLVIGRATGADTTQVRPASTIVLDPSQPLGRGHAIPRENFGPVDQAGEPSTGYPGPRKV